MIKENISLEFVISVKFIKIIKNMKTAEELKTIVKDKYGEIASKSDSNCGCGCNSPGNNDTYTINDDYTKLEGYNPDADLKLGCGIPVEHASMKEGDSVLDLGAGAGNDCFVARAIVGDKGKVTGLDFTEEMIAKANKNKSKLGYTNVEFAFGDIEKIPLEDNSFDVVISNCVLNLVPNKEKAFNEMYRVTKQGGHFCISDIVLKGELPDKIRDAAAMYAGCVSGAQQKEDYIKTIEKAGFKNISIKAEKTIDVPDYLLLNYLTMDEINDFRKKDIGIYSITVYGEK